MKCFTAIAAFGAALALGTAATRADVVLTSFQNFVLDAKFGSWGAPFAEITSGAEDWTIRSHNYGSGYKYLGGEFNCTGTDRLQLNVTVSEGVAGCLVDIVDADNNGVAFRFYGLTPGNGTNGTNDYTMIMNIADAQYFTGTGVPDWSRISQMNIEIDPGPTNNFYTATWKDITMLNPVPEPASLGLVGLGSLLAAGRRRQR